MSEEEKIEKMDKDLRFLEDNFINDNMTSVTVDIQLVKDFRKILDLYNKQKKENNKNYYEWRHLEAEVSNNYISKDIIRDKIKEITDRTANIGLFIDKETSIKVDAKIEVLNELLKNKEK